MRDNETLAEAYSAGFRAGLRVCLAWLIVGSAFAALIWVR